MEIRECATYSPCTSDNCHHVAQIRRCVGVDKAAVRRSTKRHTRGRSEEDCDDEAQHHHDAFVVVCRCELLQEVRVKQTQTEGGGGKRKWFSFI